jgi:multidrug efflux pump subunit AcrB
VLEDIAEAVVAMKRRPAGIDPPRAEVALGTATGARRRLDHNGKPAVVLGIQRQPGGQYAGTDATGSTAPGRHPEVMPAGMKIERHMFRQADFIEISIDNLIGALRDGAILVVAIVFAFLLSARSTAITLVALPLSLVAPSCR